MLKHSCHSQRKPQTHDAITIFLLSPHPLPPLTCFLAPSVCIWAISVPHYPLGHQALSEGLWARRPLPLSFPFPRVGSTYTTAPIFPGSFLTFFSPVMYESLVLSVRAEPHSHLLFKATIYQGCKTRVLERYKEWATRRQRCWRHKTGAEGSEREWRAIDQGHRGRSMSWEAM